MRVVITGAGGQLGRDLTRAFAVSADSAASAADEVIGADRARCDITDRDAVLGLITTARPDAVVHAGAWTDVDGCEADPDRAFAVNALGTRHVAEGARLTGAHLCVLSTDYVFDGRAGRPYVEWDETGPINVYGRSKLAAELEAAAGVPGVTVVRTSWLCGAGGRNFVATMLGLSGAGRPVPVVTDQHGCPTFTADLAVAIRALVAARRSGTFHVTNQGPATWFELAQAVFSAAGRDPGLVQPISTSELRPPRPAIRPAYSVLDNAALRLSGFPLLDDWHDPLARLVKELIG